MIAGIGHVNPPLVISGDAFGAVEFTRIGAGLTEREEKLLGVGLECLDPVDSAVFTGIDGSVGGNRDRTRHGELAQVGAGRAPLRNKRSQGGKMIDPGIMGFNDNDVTLLIASHSLGPAEVGLRHLPAQQIIPDRRKFLDSPREVRHVAIILGIDSQRSRFIELAESGPSGSDDFHMTEKPVGRQIESGIDRGLV